MVLDYYSPGPLGQRTETGWVSRRMAERGDLGREREEKASGGTMGKTPGGNGEGPLLGWKSRGGGG